MGRYLDALKKSENVTDPTLINLNNLPDDFGLMGSLGSLGTPPPRFENNQAVKDDSRPAIRPQVSAAVVPLLTPTDEAAIRSWLKAENETDPILIACTVEACRHNVQWRATEIAAYKADPANYCGPGALWLANLGCPK